MVGVRSVMILLSFTDMRGDHQVAVIDFDAARRIKYFNFFTDVFIRHAVIVDIFAQTNITVLHDRNDRLFLDLVAKRIERAEHFPLDILELVTAGVSAAGERLVVMDLQSGT